MLNWRKPIIYLLLYFSGSKIPRYLNEIKKVSSLSFEKQKKYQEEKMKKLLFYASKNVPYYKKVLFEAGVVINNEVFLENFSQIPILTKEIIRREGKNLYSQEIRRGSQMNFSGGSTGEPVNFLQDKYYNEWNVADKLFIKLKHNQNVGDKELRLWGSQRDFLEGKENIKIRLRNWFYNRKECNAFRMSEKKIFEYVTKWNDFKPRSVESYVHPIYELAKFIKEKKIKIFSPVSITTSAGTLFPQMKKTIKEAFNCKVYNRYGSREAGNIACDDDNEGQMLVCFWNNHLEILNADYKKCQTGELGKIYITALNNYSMPFIRFDIGDVGVFADNDYTLKKVEGRVMNMFKTRMGNLVPGEFFVFFVGINYNKNCFYRFQLIQKSLELIEIRVVLKDKSAFEKQKEKIEKCIQKEMEDENLEIKWLLVDEIPPLSSGKYCYTMSEIM